MEWGRLDSFSRLATCFFFFVVVVVLFCFVLFFTFWLCVLPARNFQSQTKDLDTKKHLLDFSLWLFLIVVVVQEFYFRNCSPPNQTFKL